VIVLTDQ